MTSHKQTRLASLMLATAFLSALTGCSLAPQYERPALPVASSWPVDSTAHDQNSSLPTVSQLGWEEFFLDRQLKLVIEQALENNRDLRIAALNIERSRALFQIQSADQIPNANFNANGARERIPHDLNTTGQAVTQSSYTVGVGITAFELDFFGRVKSLSEAALERYVATDEARRSAHIALVADVANRYIAVAADYLLINLARQTMESRQESHARQQELYINGAVSEFDLHQSESLLEAAKSNLAQQTRKLSLDENALTLLIGKPVARELLPSNVASDQLFLISTIPAGLPSDLIAIRPDIRESEALLRAKNANIGAARAAFFPRITLTGSVGTSSSELSGLFDAGSRSWNFLPQISVPIFDAGRNRANLNVAKVERDIAISQYEKSIQAAFREVADALAGTATLKEELRASEAQQKSESSRNGLAKVRYENGYSSYLEVLDAQRELFAVQQKTILAWQAELQNRIGLYKALGGGWIKSSDMTAAALTR